MSRKNISEQTEKQGRKIKVVYAKEQIISENSDYARELCNSGSYGVLLEDGRVQFSAFETLYLMEKGKVELIDFRGRTLSKEELIKKASRSDKEFLARYAIFKDLRTRGYVVKTALKFGADFRVYDRGVKPGEDHAKWIVYAVHESG
ncbi:MAG: tRNA-intron lyase, partial [Candidatus Micrarchaeia archaeon]